MHYTALNLPMKQLNPPAYQKYQSNPANRPVYRSYSSNADIGQQRSPLQIFKPGEQNYSTRQAPNDNPLAQNFNDTQKATNVSVNGSQNYTQSLYQNSAYQPHQQVSQTGISIYQQRHNNPSVNLPSYGTNPVQSFVQRPANMSEQYNRFSSMQEANKSHEFNANRRGHNDNASVHSKVSTTSKNQLLRPVSINNNDHLFNLKSKEDRLLAQNSEMINNFIKNVNSTKFNVITNMGQNFKQRITEIWNSYIKEQQRGRSVNIDKAGLDSDVGRINAYFMEHLSLKTQNYIEHLKGNCYEGIYKSLEEKNNQRLYLDNDIKNLVENDYKQAENRNRELKAEIQQAKARYESQIGQTEQKYEKLRETHMDMYDREFTFKLNQDKKLVRETLANAIPSLQNKSRKLNEKLQYIQAKNDSRGIAQLKNEIAALEAKLKGF